jgi:hypothetical protein
LERFQRVARGWPPRTAPISHLIQPGCMTSSSKGKCANPTKNCASVFGGVKSEGNCRWKWFSPRCPESERGLQGSSQFPKGSPPRVPRISSFVDRLPATGWRWARSATHSSRVTRHLPERQRPTESEGSEREIGTRTTRREMGGGTS